MIVTLLLRPSARDDRGSPRVGIGTSSADAATSGAAPSPDGAPVVARASDAGGGARADGSIATGPGPTEEGEIALSVNSKHAAVFVDGAPIGTAPLTRHFPRDGKAHVVRIERKGHPAESQTVTFSADVTLGGGPGGHGPKPNGPGGIKTTREYGP